MAEKILDEAAQGLRAMFGRLGDFFHIFDLSFFIAGVVSFGALAFTYLRLDLPRAFPNAPWVAGLALVIACYVCGLLSFALGRLVNGNLFRRAMIRTLLPRAVAAHQLGGPAIDRYLSGGQYEVWRLYIRLWQELAAKYPQSVAFAHLSRYWAMAATYDGLAISALLWAASLAMSPWVGTPNAPVAPAVVSAVIMVLSSVLCLRQGAKFYEFQIEDLVGALSAAQVRV